MDGQKSELLKELTQYHFPGLSLDQIQEEPYLTFTKMYCSVCPELNFYRGYLNPSPIERAKVYRALNLACEGAKISIRNFIIFTSSSGMVIRVKPSTYRDSSMDQVDFLFELFQKESSGRVFLPEGYDQLDTINYPYYYRLLNLFRKTLTEVSRLIMMQEYDSKMLFLSLGTEKKRLESDRDLGRDNDLEKRWRDYLDGTLKRKIWFSPHRIKKILELFPWSLRDHFMGAERRLGLKVLECFPSSLEEKLVKIRESTGDLSLRYLDLGVQIQDERELFGVLLILKESWPDLVKEMIPLMGTSKLIMSYRPEVTEEKIKEAIAKFPELDLPPEGVEIYSQDSFSELSKLKKANLVRSSVTRSGNWYSFMDLCQTPLEIDPSTRQPFSEEFKNKIKQTLEQIRGPVLEGFPPVRPELELFEVTSEDDKSSTSSLYIRSSPTQTILFWKFPPCMNDQEFINEAKKTIVIKWTDGSLFGPFKETCLKYNLELSLIFSPEVYSIFREILEDPGVNLSEKRVREQLDLLKNV